MIDRWLNKKDGSKTYSTKNEDVFRRERATLSHLNTDENEHILPYIGWDDADDAYFVVTKRLFGPKILERVSENISTKQLMRYICQMFSVIAYVRSKGIRIVMRNMNENSFQYDGKS
eukprot:936784_1